MGMSSASYLVAGVRLSDVYQVVDEERPVTRYDPVTGKPYETTEKTRRWVLFGEDVPEIDDVEFEVEKRCGLKVFSVGAVASEMARRRDYSLYFVGVQVVEASHESSSDAGFAAQASPAECAAALRQAAEKLKALGCEAEPSLWLVSYQSY